jgi:hypothetical protein
LTLRAFRFTLAYDKTASGFCTATAADGAVSVSHDRSTMPSADRLVVVRKDNEMRWLSILAAAVSTASLWAPSGHADVSVGNYQLNIAGRYDFHTWIWAVAAPRSGAGTPGCVHVAGLPQPTAKASYYEGDARLTDGRYTLVIDDPFGLRCGDVYYGPTIPTRDIYTWDAITLSGNLESSYGSDCGGSAGGTTKYPFTLTRM